MGSQFYDYDNLKLAVRNDYLRVQNFYRFLCSEKFERAFGLANVKEKEEVGIYIEKQDRYLTSVWMKKIYAKVGEFESLPICDLREIARKLGITHYYYLPHDSLLCEVNKVMKLMKNYGV